MVAHQDLRICCNRGSVLTCAGSVLVNGRPGEAEIDIGQLASG